MRTPRTETLLPLALGLGLMFALSLWPHVSFSRLVGEIATFKNAFDEDTYVLYPTGFGSLSIHRLFPGIVTQTLVFVLGGSLSLTLIALDAIFMPLAFLGAYAVACVLVKNGSGRLLVALITLFSPDLFSLGNSAVYSDTFATIANLRNLFGEWGNVLVPPIETSYLGVVRSPEPQISYFTGFVFIAVLLRTTLDTSPSVNWLMVVAQILTGSALVFGYTIVSVPLFGVAALAAVILLFVGSWQKAAVMFVIVGVAFGLLAVSSLNVGTNAPGLVFASRLPTVTMTGLLSVPVLGFVIILLARRRWRDRRLWLALTLAGMPIILTNQQLFTGTMISARDWERTICAPLLVIGTIMALGIVAVEAHVVGDKWRRTSSMVCWAAVGVLSLEIAAAANQSQKYFMRANIDSVVMARVVTAAGPAIAGRIIVMDHPGLAPLLRVRAQPELGILLDYSTIFTDPIPPALGNAFVPGDHAFKLFDHWRLLGIKPAEAADILEMEAAGRGGYYSSYLFNLCEHWYPCTDNRGVAVDKIAMMVPQAVDAYADFLGRHGRDAANGYALILTQTEAVPRPDLFDSEPVARETLAGSAARLYLGK